MNGTHTCSQSETRQRSPSGVLGTSVLLSGFIPCFFPTGRRLAEPVRTMGTVILNRIRKLLWEGWEGAASPPHPDFEK